MDIIGLVAEETERQRETLPHAVRRVAYRSVFYYVGAVFILGLNVSVRDPILANIAEGGGFFSPFILMVQRAGFPRMRHFINAIILVAVTSTANTRLYVSVVSSCLKLTGPRVGPCTPWPERVKDLVFARERIG